MSDIGIRYSWFRDDVMLQYSNSDVYSLTNFEEWAIKEHFKTLLALEKCYNLLPEGDYGDDIIEIKQRLFNLQKLDRNSTNPIKKNEVIFKSIKIN